MSTVESDSEDSDTHEILDDEEKVEAEVDPDQFTRPKTFSKSFDCSSAWTQVAQPHIDSFNFFLDAGLDMAVASIEPVHIPLYDTRNIVTASSSSSSSNKKKSRKAKRKSKSGSSDDEESEGDNNVEDSDEDSDNDNGSASDEEEEEEEDNLGQSQRTMEVWISSVDVGHPMKSDDSADQRIFPAECRERHISYNGALNLVSPLFSLCN